jgi:hypothetical protein
MTRRVVLVDFFWTRQKDPRVPLGHASLLASLRQSAYVEAIPVVHAVNQPGTSVEATVATIVGHLAGVADSEVDVAIGAYAWAEPLVRATLSSLRRAGFRGRIIVGGPQVSYAPAGIERAYPEADAFVRGYGEGALVELTRQPGRPEIRGVHYVGQPDRCEPSTVDLQVLPSPWVAGIIPLAGQKFIRWETQRGCPFRCSFCQHCEAGARLPRRDLASSRIAQEVELFCRAGVDDIAVLDPIFNLGRHSVFVLRQLAAGGFSGRLSVQCRAELVDEAFLEATGGLHVRLEFGLQTIHDGEGRAIRRQNRIDRVDAVLAAVRHRNLKHEVSLIYGLPEQTLESFLKSVSWCLDRRVPVIKAFPLLLLRGTALDLERARWGLIESGGDLPAVVSSHTFSPADWAMMARVSQALQLTEGSHPATISGLLAIARDLDVSTGSWRPAATADAA